MVADADGRNAIVLDAMVHSPSPMTWSADGRFIVYFQDRRQRRPGLHGRLRTAHRRTRSPAGHKPTGARRSRPMADTIAFVRGFPEIIGIYVVQVRRHREDRLTSARMTRSTSRSGRRTATTLALRRGHGREEDEDFWAVGLDGKPERRIVGSPGNDMGPTWSPDGPWIAYLSCARRRQDPGDGRRPDGSDPHRSATSATGPTRNGHPMPGTC